MRRIFFAGIIAWCAIFTFVGCDLSNKSPIIVDPVVDPTVKVEFRCLILEETADRTKLPEGQLSILTSGTVRDYLTEHCVKGKDGTPEFRFFDKDAKLTDTWIGVVKTNPPTSYPWLYASNGKTGYSGPLPNTVNEFLAKIKPYAETK
jgi:hypothetical protein